MVPERGLEPPQVLPYQFLRLACLPIPPLRLNIKLLLFIFTKVRDFGIAIVFLAKQF